MVVKALIIGISGQDGSYLASYLRDLGVSVLGTTRDLRTLDIDRLSRVVDTSQITLRSLDIINPQEVSDLLIQYQPDLIFNLAGLTSVAKSFKQPYETVSSIYQATLTLLEAIRNVLPSAKFFNASSTDCFGNQPPYVICDESTRFCPSSPYAIAKASAYWLVRTYRESYNLHVCSGITSNHESPLRGSGFVTQKIIKSVRDIAARKQDTIELGNLNIARDWGWAPEYVQAMHMIVNAPEPSDFIIATGSTSTLQHFVDLAFTCASLDSKNHVSIKDSLIRPTDISEIYLSPKKIGSTLGWKSKATITQIVEAMYVDKLWID